uniref:Phosphatidylinositol-specific phospholipase C X domain-containing protein n=1 Tax=Neogobius melanostomus TaxID=47308 RepID=A0A8C6U1N6_9GOBI
MAKKQEQSKNQNESASYSDWMSQLPAHKQTSMLYDLVIPGSHDSMSYDLDINSSIIEPNLLKTYSHMRIVRAIMERWAKTQESTMRQQLDAGARYFDLRIARKENDPDPTRLYFYHGLLTHTDVETVLRAINDWAEQHPKEIIILALSHFKGFGSNELQLHQHLVSFIKSLFTTKLVPKPMSKEDAPTLQKCWHQKQNVIVSYDYAEATKQPDIWYKINYFYGDGVDLGQVEESLTRNLNVASHLYFSVCGLNLTLPEDAGAIKYILRWRSLASLIRSSLPELLKWIEQQAAKTQLNIVASDLVTEDNVIPTIVRLNTK